MSQTYTPPAQATSASNETLRWALLGVWAVLSLGALGFVTAIGTNAPYADEWEFVPVLLGAEPQHSWLWEQHNEHRLPLPRAIYLGLFKLTRDFRAGMVLQVVTLSALALGLMRLSARLRGNPHWSDVFFPVSLLHVGHWENFVMGYQICFVFFAVLVSGLVVLALQITRENAFRFGVWAGVLLAMLALSGGSGLAAVPPVSVWLVFIAIVVWREGAKGKAAILLLLAVLPLVYLGVYFVGYERPVHHKEPSSDPLAILRVGSEVLAMSVGIGLSGVWWAVFAGMLVLGIATVSLLVRRWKEPAERLSVIGLIAVALGVVGVAVAIGVGRGAWGGGMGLWSRYSLLVWPLLAAGYLVWVKFGRKWVPIVLCCVAALAFPTNMLTGMAEGAMIKSEYSALEADVRLGISAEQIVEKEEFKRSHQASQKERVIRGIPLLRAAGIGIFRK
ncbi:MAG: hypothetical protein L0241_14895 [Planctomycetia bacterium]|nr:hypothetical protein [Planctomycetia bacterium]